jgi:hypothetical protein
VLTTNTLVLGAVAFYDRHGYKTTELTRYTDKIILAHMMKVVVATERSDNGLG